MHCSLDYRRDCQQHCYRSIVVSYISFITLYTGETLDFFQSSGNKPVSKLWLINNYSTSAHRICRVCTLFWTENSRTFQGLSRTPFSAKKSLKSVFFSSSTTWAISSWRSFCVCPFYAIENLGLIKLAPKFKDFPALTEIFKNFSRPWIFILKSKDFKDLKGACEPWIWDGR